jgi:hypothetical protein
VNSIFPRLALTTPNPIISEQSTRGLTEVGPLVYDPTYRRDAGNCGGAGNSRLPRHPYQACSRDAFMLLERGWPAHQGGGVDRGCPLGTGLVRLMWHAGGTASEGKRVRGRPRGRPTLVLPLGG